MGLYSYPCSFPLPLNLPPLLRLLIVTGIMLLLAVGAVDWFGTNVLTVFMDADVGVNLMVLA